MIRDLLKRIFLLPISWCYGFVVKLRNLLYDNGIKTSKEYSFPIICVGNITVGGTGKTPHIEYLIRLLQGSYRVSVLSRGYKRKTKGYREVDANESPKLSGDEPLQIKKKFPSVKVVVDEKRVNGVDTLLSLKGYDKPEVILLDDAFQHRAICAGLNIVLTDYNRLVTRDNFLPMGRLRDSVNELKRADIVIVTKCPSDLIDLTCRSLKEELFLDEHQKLFFSTFSYGKTIPVFSKVTEGSTFSISSRIQKRVLLFTGIANPSPLIKYLSEKRCLVETIKFPDHYEYDEKDLDKIESTIHRINDDNLMVLTTEKDMVKLKSMPLIPPILKEKLRYITIEVNFLSNGKDPFEDAILHYIKRAQITED